MNYSWHILNHQQTICKLNEKKTQGGISDIQDLQKY